MDKKKNNPQTLSEMKDKHIGKPGTQERVAYENKLRMEVLGRMIKSAKKD